MNVTDTATQNMENTSTYHIGIAINTAIVRSQVTDVHVQTKESATECIVGETTKESPTAILSYTGPWVVGGWFEADGIGHWQCHDVFSDVDEARAAVQYLRDYFPTVLPCMLSVSEWEKLRV